MFLVSACIVMYSIRCVYIYVYIVDKNKIHIDQIHSIPACTFD